MKASLKVGCVWESRHGSPAEIRIAEIWIERNRFRTIPDSGLIISVLPRLVTLVEDLLGLFVRTNNILWLFWSNIGRSLSFRGNGRQQESKTNKDTAYAFLTSHGIRYDTRRWQLKKIKRNRLRPGSGRSSPSPTKPVLQDGRSAGCEVPTAVLARRPKEFWAGLSRREAIGPCSARSSR